MQESRQTVTRLSGVCRRSHSRTPLPTLSMSLSSSDTWCCPCMPQLCLAPRVSRSRHTREHLHVWGSLSMGCAPGKSHSPAWQWRCVSQARLQSLAVNLNARPCSRGTSPCPSSHTSSVKWVSNSISLKGTLHDHRKCSAHCLVHGKCPANEMQWETFGSSSCASNNCVIYHRSSSVSLSVQWGLQPRLCLSFMWIGIAHIRGPAYRRCSTYFVCEEQAYIFISPVSFA